MQVLDEVLAQKDIEKTLALAAKERDDSESSDVEYDSEDLEKTRFRSR